MLCAQRTKEKNKNDVDIDFDSDVFMVTVVRRQVSSLFAKLHIVANSLVLMVIVSKKRLWWRHYQRRRQKYKMQCFREEKMRI